MKKSPLQQAQQRFGKEDRVEAKAALVSAVKELAESGLWIDRLSFEKGLENVSNRKLLHLHEVLSTVKDKFSNRAGLIDAILVAEKRSKDAGFQSRLESFPTPRLWDHYRTLSS